MNLCTPYCTEPCAPACESCPRCGHRLEDHDERDGCGACAMAMTGRCHPSTLGGVR